jgi:hypothetical protein
LPFEAYCIAIRTVIYAEIETNPKILFLSELTKPRIIFGMEITD